MKYIKYTLWIIPAFLVVFQAFAGKKQLEQRDAVVKAEEFAIYGKQGKSKDTSIKNIKLSGTIYKETVYRISVSYSAHSDSRLCKNWGLFSGVRQSSKLYWYEPVIKDGRHSISIPLDEHNPKRGCQYKLHYVNLWLDRGGKPLASGNIMLFYANRDTPLNPPTYGFKRQALSGEGDIINIECVLPDPDNIHYSYSPCGLAPVKNRIAVSQYLHPNISKYELNIQFLSQDEYNNTL